jgi:hypothetical protein
MVLLMKALKIVVFAPLVRLGKKRLKLAYPAPTLSVQNAMPLVATASNVVVATL